MAIGANWAEIWAPIWGAVWSQTPAEPEPDPPATEASGGFFFGFDHARAQRQRRQKELDEMEAEQQAIEDAQAREIAQLLRKQEAKDAAREDLARIQALADQFVGQPLGVPARARAAIYNAHEQRTVNALEQMRREIERMYEEEEQAQVAALLMDD